MVEKKRSSAKDRRLIGHSLVKGRERTSREEQAYKKSMVGWKEKDVKGRRMFTKGENIVLFQRILASRGM